MPITLTPAHAALDLIARMVAALELTQLVSVCSFDRNGVMQFCNQACAEMLGIMVEEALGQRVASLCSFGERQAEYDAMVEEIWRDGHACPAGDWRVKTGDGRELWLYSTCIPVWHEGDLAQISRILPFSPFWEQKAPWRRIQRRAGDERRAVRVRVAWAGGGCRVGFWDARDWGAADATFYNVLQRFRSKQARGGGAAM